MLGTRKNFEDPEKNAVGDIDARLQLESLLYLRKHDPEKFEKAKQKLEGTDIWKAFERRYES